MLGGVSLGSAGLEPAPAASPEAFAALRKTTTVWTLAAIVAVALLGVGIYTGVLPITAVQIADAGGLLLLLLTLGFFGWLFVSGGWTADERRRLYVIGVLFVASTLFWSVFEQAGSTLNLFADRSSDNRVFGYAFPSTWYQSLNSLFLITLAPVFAWVWARLASRGEDPSRPAKFAMGLVFVGLGFAILVGPARAAEQGALVSPLWLTTTYLLHTIGELALSPVGLSAMSTLAPARIAGLIMGVWFLSISVGNFLGGRIASLYESMALPSLFGVVASFAVVAGVILFALVPAMRRLTDQPVAKAPEGLAPGTLGTP
jgi:POT family proton-dependent oligopeptide transporter